MIRRELNNHANKAIGLDIDLSKESATFKDSFDNFIRFTLVHHSRLEEARTEQSRNYADKTQDYIDIFNASVEAWRKNGHRDYVVYYVNSSSFLEAGIAHWEDSLSKIPEDIKEELKNYEFRRKGNTEFHEYNLRAMEQFVRKYSEEVNDSDTLARDLLNVLTEEKL